MLNSCPKCGKPYLQDCDYDRDLDFSEHSEEVPDFSGTLRSDEVEEKLQKQISLLERIAKLGEEVAEFYGNEKHWMLDYDSGECCSFCPMHEDDNGDLLEKTKSGKLARQKLAEIKKLREELGKL